MNQDVRSPQAVSSPLLIVAALMLLAAAASALALGIQHLSSLALPGCGPTSACAELAASRWGNLGGWPVAYLGAAYFFGLAVAFFVHREKRLAVPARLLLSLGGLVSLFYLGIMATEQKWCLYCLVSHLFHLGALALIFYSTEASVQNRGWWFGLCGAGLAATVAFGIAEWQTTTQVSSEQRALTEQSIEQVLEQTPKSPESATVTPPSDGGFTGRYRRGPEQASVRLVVFHDYQCKDCAELDAELEQLLETYPTLSLSIRHYPMCSQCNPNISWDFFHTQACRAAYLAEAAYRIGGEDLFWEFHRWLFENKVKFEEAELKQFCDSQKIDFDQLLATADSDEIQNLVQEDIDLAISLGATGTPFVFLNGVEIRGTSSNPGNARLAVEKVMAANPPRRSSAWDRFPPGAEERLLTEWQAEDAVELPAPEKCRLVFGNPEGSHRIVIYLEPTDRQTAVLWRNALAMAQQSDNVRLEMYLYPIHSELNPRFAKLSKELFPSSAKFSRVLAALRKTGSSQLAEAISVCLQCDYDIAEQELIEQVASAAMVEPTTLQELSKAPETLAEIEYDLSQATLPDVGWAPAVYIHARSAPSAAVSQQVMTRMLETDFAKLSSPDETLNP
ncbi:DsbA family protein [Rubinisphaera sp.]|uniref:DsbA family protein n=1 Tax=Rubinisphaera sp. TaxID=2024857 RepID=UPI000C0F29D8|nr:DsbA family protein [Rubinisphaera sp.]MBV09675.1 hypothetical protein [Rubinisphaera sp.]HCS51214.1 hypothetical protein [Planctomycetaceae bacterium]|tara:strand:- start:883 stop:2739 length:1857 start_codon:yes stop_codon:yes gene_type:complete